MRARGCWRLSWAAKIIDIVRTAIARPYLVAEQGAIVGNVGRHVYPALVADGLGVSGRRNDRALSIDSHHVVGRVCHAQILGVGRIDGIVEEGRGGVGAGRRSKARWHICHAVGRIGTVVEELFITALPRPARVELDWLGPTEHCPKLLIPASDWGLANSAANSEGQDRDEADGLSER